MNYHEYQVAISYLVGRLQKILQKLFFFWIQNQNVDDDDGNIDDLVDKLVIHLLMSIANAILLVHIFFTHSLAKYINLDGKYTHSLHDHYIYHFHIFTPS